jgi:radical SAM-linked protein
VVLVHSFRVRFAKESSQRHLSHLELVRGIERAIRRAQLEMVYSEGFHPHPKLSFGPALAVGIASEDEYFDLELTRDYPPEEILESINKALIGGLKVLAVKKILNRVKPLNAIINRASYVMILRTDPRDRSEIIDQLNKLLTSTSVEIVRTNKNGQKIVNIRPWLHNLTIRVKNNDLLELEFVGEIGSGGNLRPDDLQGVISRPFEALAITRTGLWREEDGTVTRPLDFCDKVGG